MEKTRSKKGRPARRPGGLAALPLSGVIIQGEVVQSRAPDTLICSHLPGGQRKGVLGIPSQVLARSAVLDLSLVFRYSAGKPPSQFEIKYGLHLARSSHRRVGPSQCVFKLPSFLLVSKELSRSGRRCSTACAANGTTWIPWTSPQELAAPHMDRNEARILCGSV